MKNIKILTAFLWTVVTMVLLVGCGGADERQEFLDGLKEIDQTEIVALDAWIDENYQQMYDLFEVVDVHVDLAGNVLDFETQVASLTLKYYDSWSFDVADDVLTFTHRWDYEQAMLDLEEEHANSVTTDDDILYNWLTGDVIPFVEDITLENPLHFFASLAGFVSGTRNMLEDLNTSAYLDSQIELVLTFFDDTNSLVLEHQDDDTLDLAEIQSIMLTTLEGMRDIFN